MVEVGQVGDQALVHPGEEGEGGEEGDMEGGEEGGERYRGGRRGRGEGYLGGLGGGELGPLSSSRRRSLLQGGTPDPCTSTHTLRGSRNPAIWEGLGRRCWSRISSYVGSVTSSFSSTTSFLSFFLISSSSSDVSLADLDVCLILFSLLTFSLCLLLSTSLSASSPMATRGV